MPAGTKVIVEFSGASAVDPEPWKYWEQNETAGFIGNAGYEGPNRLNFSLDPLKAGDSHIRKFDRRNTGIGGVARDWWTYYYNRSVTDYTLDPNQITNAGFLQKFTGPNEVFTGHDIHYFNWRFIMINNVDATPPISPSIDTFAVTYRFEPSN